MYEALILDLQERLKRFPTDIYNPDFYRLKSACDAMEAMNSLFADLQVEITELRTQHRTEHCEAAEYACEELGRLRAALTRVEAERDAYRALGSVEELSALVKARDEGRVVALPCKPNAAYLHRNYDTGGLELNVELHDFGGDESDFDFEEIDACAYWE